MARWFGVAGCVATLVLGTILWRVVLSLTLPLSTQDAALVIGLIFAATVAASVTAFAIFPRKNDDDPARPRGATGHRARWLREFLKGKPQSAWPWYVMIGLQGAGKSSLLSGAGFTPRGTRLGLSAHEAEGLLVVEMPGDVVQPQAAVEGAPAAWRDMLRSMRQGARNRPPQGILITVSAETLATTSDEAVHSLARSWRARLADLAETFGRSLPAYVIVTHLDELPGAAAVLSGLTAGDAQAVVGVSLDRHVGADAASNAFAAELSRLSAHFNARLLARPRTSGAPASPEEGLEFAAQFDALCPAVARFMGRLVTRRYRDLPIAFRGAYLTANPPVSEGRVAGYFSRDIFGTVLPGERRWARDVSRRWLAWPWRMAMGVSVVATLGAGALIGANLLRDREVLTEARDTIAAFAPAQVQESLSQTSFPPDAPLDEVLAPLNQLAALSRRAEATTQTDTAWWRRATDRSDMAAAAQDAYDAALGRLLHPRLLAEAKTTLQHAVSQGRAPEAWRALRVYLSLADPERPEANEGAVATAFDRVWRAQERDGADRTRRQRLLTHLVALMRGRDRAALPIDAGLVAQARTLSRQESLASMAYGDLLDGAAGRFRPNPLILRPVEPRLFRVSRAGGAEVPGLYAPEAFWGEVALIVPVLAESTLQDVWVLGPDATAPPNAADLEREIYALYGADFEAQWTTALAALEVSVVPNQERALATLAGAGTRVETLVRRILTLTQMARTPFRVQAEAQIDDPAQMARAIQAAETIEEIFAPWHSLVSGFDPGLAPVTDGFEALEEAVTRRQTASDETETMLTTLETASAALPEPSATWVRAILRAYRRAFWPPEAQALAQVLATRILPFCEGTVAQAYPFAAGSPISLSEFERYFARDGLLESVRDLYLADVLERTDTGLELLPDTAFDQVVTPRFLEAFDQAERLRETYFEENGRLLGIRFQVEVVGRDPDVRDLRLDIHGTPLRVDGGTRLVTATWPGARPEIRLSAGGDQPRIFTGDWALVDFLSSGDLREGAAFVDVTHEVEGGQVTFRLRFDQAGVPFLGEAIAPIQCPDP